MSSSGLDEAVHCLDHTSRNVAALGWRQKHALGRRVLRDHDYVRGHIRQRQVAENLLLLSQSEVEANEILDATSDWLEVNDADQGGEDRGGASRIAEGGGLAGALGFDHDLIIAVTADEVLGVEHQTLAGLIALVDDLFWCHIKPRVDFDQMPGIAVEVVDDLGHTPMFKPGNRSMTLIGCRRDNPVIDATGQSRGASAVPERVLK